MNYKTKPYLKQQTEKGQALVIGAGILFCLAITMMLYLSIQRAYNLANFLDETAELAAQSAAEPIADDIVNGQVRIDSTRAIEKSSATIRFSAQSVSGEINPSSIISTTTTINPGDTNTICAEYNLDPLEDTCLFPLVVVDLELPHRLFGLDFTITSRGVATLGANSRRPEAVPIVLPEPTALSPSTPIIITIVPGP
ncbi:MAG: hypothetical protein AB8G95_03880 [Anaerolineae bacterium]